MRCVFEVIEESNLERTDKAYVSVSTGDMVMVDVCDGDGG